MSQATTISSWGNSEAVRIPRGILQSLGLRSGDKVNVQATEHGSIEISPIRSEHRRVQPKKGITFDALFKGWEAQLPTAPDAWPNDDLVGAEMDAWR